VVLIVGLALPGFYLLAPWATALVSPVEPREYQYSRMQVRVSDAQIQAVLRSLAQTMNPDELSRLRDRLKGTVQLPFSDEDPLVSYLRVLSEFSDSMVQMETMIYDAQDALSSGDIQRAEVDLKQLRDLRAQTRPLSRSLPRLLNEGADYYKIDTAVQLQKLEELNGLFQSYSEQIDQLALEVETQQGLVSTKLSLNSSAPEVFVEEPLSVYGFLNMENGTALASKNVTISWGTNTTVNSVTDAKGRFDAAVSFPVGFPAGPTLIDARFEPQGPDSYVYVPTMSSLEIRVMYYPSVILATINPMNVRPLDSVEVEGNLTTPEGRPLESRTIQIHIDGTSVGDTETNASGQFLFGFSVPNTLRNGTHHVTVTFTAADDRYAPSNATLPFTLEFLPTQLEVAVDRASLFSGTKLTLDGSVSLANGTRWKYGHVAVFLDGLFYGNEAVGEDGSFLSVLEMPMGIPWGAHSVSVEYYPDESWVEESQATSQLFIYNTPLVAFAATGILAASSLAAYTMLRRRRAISLAPEQPQQPVLEERPPPREDYSPDRLTSLVQSESDEASKIRRSYRLAQALISDGLGESARESETHWEYFSRVTDKKPSLRDSLERLSELFELAEYSPYPIGRDQAREATEILLRLRDEIKAVK